MKAGDWVKLKPGAGFGQSGRLKAEIQPDEPMSCVLCENSKCKEWSTLWTEPDPENDGKRYTVCHVSECEMTLTEPPKWYPN